MSAIPDYHSRAHDLLRYSVSMFLRGHEKTILIMVLGVGMGSRGRVIHDTGTDNCFNFIKYHFRLLI